MATTGTGNFSDLLVPGLRKIFNASLSAIPDEWPWVYNQAPSSRNFEEDLKVAGFGAMGEKPEGQPIAYDDPVTGSKVKYTHTSYGMGFRVTREMWEDDLYGVIRRYPRELAQSAKHTREVRGWRLLNNAFTAATFAGFDGKGLCVDDHPLLKSGGTGSNVLAASADLSVSALEEAITVFQDWENDSGFPVGGLYRPTTLIVGSVNEFLATRIIGSQYAPFTTTPNAGGGGDTGANTYQINPDQVTGLKVLVSHYLTDPDSWFLLSSNHDMNWFWRTKIRFDNADDFDTKDAKFSAFERYSQGFGDWRGIVGSPGA